MDERTPIDPGVAGASARREADRRWDRRELARAFRPLLLRLLPGPSAEERRLAAEEKHWAAGASGEVMLAEALARRCPEVMLLRDRGIQNTRANIDLIAVVVSGVYVIDAKRCRGKIKVRQPLFGEPKLIIAGHDRTKLVQGLDRQLASVQAALGSACEAPVHRCLCFLAPEGLLADSGLPVLRTLEIDGYPLYYPRRLAKRLNRSGGLSSERASQILGDLAAGLPKA